MATLHDVPDHIWEETPLRKRDVGFYFALLPYTRLWTVAGWVGTAIAAYLVGLAVAAMIVTV
ncbi:MAG: hypothetical protein IPK85_01740 [Gemmatimonadetes bacterium]|nr:hypothetical protein [Gemmatimonadota bacterium]